MSTAAGALLGGALAPSAARARTEPPALRIVSAARIGGADGGVIATGETLAPFSLPGRAHAVVRLSSTEVLAVGRRPGPFAAVLNLADAKQPHRLIAPLGGHRFAGHAALSPDGATLATSEIDAETGVGAIALRNSKSGAVRVSAPAGIEPHDLVFTADGARLVVAIGGIARAADIKGPALNLGRIESAVLELDPRTGALLKCHTLAPDLSSLSLRHLALAPDGQTVAIGMQDQDRSQLRPLMALLRPGRGLELLPLPADEPTGLRFYVGSVAIDAGNTYVASTSPKGGRIGRWRVSDGRPLSGFALADVCGLAASNQPGRFIATSGHGDLVELVASDSGFTALRRWQAPLAFDNHLLAV